MPKVAKKNLVKKVVTVEELNRPHSAKRGRPKNTVQRHGWFKAITLLLLTAIAVSSSYIAYELKNTSYRISVIAQYE